MLCAYLLWCTAAYSWNIIPLLICRDTCWSKLNCGKETLWLNMGALRGSWVCTHVCREHIEPRSKENPVVSFFWLCFADCQTFLLLRCLSFSLFFPALSDVIFQLFGHTLASIWMSPSIKNRSRWYSCKSLLYHFSLFWWFRRAYALCKLKSKYGFLLTRQEKYDLRQKVESISFTQNNK